MAAKTVGNSKSRASDILVTHHDDLCKALTISETTLFSLTGKLYSKRIVDFRTKSEITSKGGYKGADTLMDYLGLRVDNNSNMLYYVLQAMRELEALKDIVEKMESWEGEDTEISTDPPAMTVTEEVDKLDPVAEAEKLKQEFEELLVIILESLVGVNLDNLKLRISWFFNATGVNTPEVQAIVDELQSIPTPQIVLNFLISRNIIGYLNYQLIKAFQKAVKNDEVEAKIMEYEEKHDAFLYHFSFNAIIEAFKSNPDLAPVSTIGLPKFTVELQDPWEGKRVYQWKEVVLDRMFTWSPHLIVVSLKKKCIVLTYAVLPFFISSVVQDLENPSVIKQLELEGVSVELSSDLLKSEKRDDKWLVMKELEVQLGGKKETPSKRGEDNTSEEEQDTNHNSGNSVDLQDMKYEPLSKSVPEDIGHITRCSPVFHPQPPNGGYDEDIFIITPSDSLKCPVCLLVVRDPYLLSCCGALICQICIKRIENDQKLCPCCRSDDFTKILDKRTRGELLGQRVRCKNCECKWKGELLDLEKHISGECLYAPEICQYGCGKYYNRYTLPVHEQDECPNRPLHVIIESSQTNKKKLTELEVKYQEQGVLLNEYKSLVEKYEMEIQDNNEQQQKMSKMEQELSVLQACTDFTAGKVPEWLIPVSPYYYPPFIRVMNSFSKCKKASSTWYSLPFQTQPGGYTLRLQVVADGSGHGKGTHVSVRVHLMKGENDAKLEWPFKGQIIVRLLNWREDKQHVEKVINFSDDDPLQSCSRVIEGEKPSIGLGYDRFVSHVDLDYSPEDNTEYLCDDMLCFQVYKITLLSGPEVPRWYITPVTASPYLLPPCTISMPDFSEHKRVSDRWYSPPFYTRPDGYKLQLNVDVDGSLRGKGTHVTVYVNLMKGEYDHMLTWPFKCDITIQLLNWREDKGHVEKTIPFNDSYDIKHRKRVMEGDRALGLGFDRFISYSDLYYNITNNTEYVNNDILCFVVSKVTE